MKKILRSIKQRSLGNQTTPKKLNSQHGSKRKRKGRSKINPNSKKRKLEFGENSMEVAIETCLITSDDDDDDDCVLIEPIVQNIILGDDEPSTSRFAIAAAASTPLIVKNGIRRQLQKEDDVPNGSFFKDSYGDTILKYAKCNKKPPKYSISSDQLSTHPNHINQSSEIVILDETRDFSYVAENELSTANDSVVFVKENIASDFIPLVSKDVPNHIPAVREIEPFEPIRKAHSLFSASEKKALRQYNTNTYNPAAGLPECGRGKKRYIVIDGSNVAYGHALSKQFSVEGLRICIEYFVKMGHEVKAVVPLYRKNPHKSSNPKLLEQLNQSGKIVFTPCKNIPGLVTSSYDDRFVLQLACELDAAIISNDNYRDLITESAAFKKLIENRVIGYTWCNDIFILPKDPYGRIGPTLDSILNMRS